MKLSEFIPVSGIYIIKNIKNHKVYVGQSKQMLKRWCAHVIELMNGQHTCKEFLLDVQKYGLESFEVQVVEECEIKELISKEAEWAIKVYQSGSSLYNLSNDKRMINVISAISGSYIS